MAGKKQRGLAYETKEIERIIIIKKGLAYEISEIDKMIVSKHNKGKPTSIEEGFLKSYLRILKRENPLEYARIAPELKSVRLRGKTYKLPIPEK